MNSKVQTILLSICTTLVIGLVVGVMVWMTLKKDPVVCSKLNIYITDINERNYVSDRDLRNHLETAGLQPVGMLASQLPLQAMEDCILQHPLIRTAECYRTNQGDACLRVTQRVPKLRVITATESYFVDTDRKRMPVRKSVDSDVLVVSGHVGERMACNELFDMVTWIEKNAFWRERILRIDIREGKQIVLKQQGNEPLIILGEINEYKTKMKKLQTYLSKITEEMGLPTYRELDIRFKNEVIGRK